jgi:hypothetical protein
MQGLVAIASLADAAVSGTVRNAESHSSTADLAKALRGDHRARSDAPILIEKSARQSRVH